MQKSEENKVKLASNDNDYNQILNNIKQEPPVEFELILPPREYKSEEEENNNIEGKKYQCQKCSKSFDKHQPFKSHQRNHRPKMKCQICLKEIAARNFTFHLKRHKGVKELQCDHCSRMFAIKYDLKNHITLKHRSFRNFNCQFCGKGYNRKHIYEHHIIKNHSNEKTLSKETKEIFLRSFFIKISSQ